MTNRFLTREEVVKGIREMNEELAGGDPKKLKAYWLITQCMFGGFKLSEAEKDEIGEAFK